MARGLHVLLVCLLAATAGAGADEEKSVPGQYKLTDKTFADVEGLNAQGEWLVVFCDREQQLCRDLANEWSSLHDALQTNNVFLAVLDVKDSPQAAAKHNFAELPGLLLLKDGEVVKQQSGLGEGVYGEGAAAEALLRWVGHPMHSAEEGQRLAAAAQEKKAQEESAKAEEGAAATASDGGMEASQAENKVALAAAHVQADGDDAVPAAALERAAAAGGGVSVAAARIGGASGPVVLGAGAAAAAAALLLVRWLRSGPEKKAH